MARVTNTVQRQVIDEDGRVLHSEKDTTVNWGPEPNYIKVYLDDILYLSDLPKGLNSILYALLKRMAYGNQLVINAALKRQIAAEVHLSTSSINNAITKFVKGKLLKREDTGLYIVNPQLFGKGAWKDNAKIRLTATYDFSGRTIMAEIENSSDNDYSEAPPAKEQPDDDEFETHDDSELSPGERLPEELEEAFQS